MVNHVSTGRYRRFVWAPLFAATMAICVMPLGCGAADEGSAFPDASQPMLPPSTVEALQTCAKERVGYLQHHAYEIGFDIKMFEDGVISSVKPSGHRLDDSGMERCFIAALQAMPPEVGTVQSFWAPSVSHRVGGPTRGVLASTAVLPHFVEWTPVIIGASGTTIVVTVAVIVVVVAVVAMADATMSEECEEEWRREKRKCAEFLDWNDPPRGVTGGYVDTRECAKGNVREVCGGNLIDWGNKGGRPGRRY